MKRRYIIMANGSGVRWGNHGGIPKQLIEIEGETLLGRTTRLLHDYDERAEVVIASSNPLCVADGALRYAPKCNEYEIDRFVPELVEDGCCFLYGDVFYTPSAIEEILGNSNDSLLFFGNAKSIVAVKVGSSSDMRRHYINVRRLFVEGFIDQCKGWQLYQSFTNQSFGEVEIVGDFVYLADETTDFNSPEELNFFMASRGK